MTSHFTHANRCSCFTNYSNCNWEPTQLFRSFTCNVNIKQCKHTSYHPQMCWKVVFYVTWKPQPVHCFITFLTVSKQHLKHLTCCFLLSVCVCVWNSYKPHMHILKISSSGFTHCTVEKKCWKCNQVLWATEEHIPNSLGPATNCEYVLVSQLVVQQNTIICPVRRSGVSSNITHLFAHSQIEKMLMCELSYVWQQRTSHTTLNNEWWDRLQALTLSHILLLHQSTVVCIMDIRSKLTFYYFQISTSECVEICQFLCWIVAYGPPNWELEKTPSCQTVCLV